MKLSFFSPWLHGITPVETLTRIVRLSSDDKMKGQRHGIMWCDNPWVKLLVYLCIVVLHLSGY